jgi:hypothetical protein
MSEIEGFATSIGLGSVALLAAIINAFWSWFVKLNTNREVEELKSKLKNIENERSIRLSRLIDKQLDVMIDLYEKMSNLEGLMDFYSGPRDWDKLKSNSEFKMLYDDIVDFQKSFYKNKVFLPKKLDVNFSEFFEVAQRIKITYRMLKDDVNYEVNKRILDENSIEDMNYIGKHLPELKKEIEQEYRNLWGINS